MDALRRVDLTLGYVKRIRSVANFIKENIGDYTRNEWSIDKARIKYG